MDINELQFASSEDGSIAIGRNSRLDTFKDWFRESVESSDQWRELAREDREFYIGKQWRDEDRKSLEDNKRPAITINKIKPLINVLSGYQRLNRYDIEFLPRTNDDMELAQLRKGITKYILDTSHYNYEESDVFNDSVVSGIGWFEVGYKFDYERMDGDAFIRRVSPFDIYTDPESRDKYFRDAKFIIRARWVDKEELISVYPEHRDEILAQTRYYMAEEDETDSIGEKLWYRKDTNKIRFAECWYKQIVRKSVYILHTGEMVTEVAPEHLVLGLVAEERSYSTEEIRMISFFDNVVLEDIESPYQHKQFPFVPFSCYYQGDDDIPAGIVRDLKDPQREINKRRSQELHILNTQSNGGWIFEQSALTAEQKSKFKANASTPGALLEVGVGALTGGRLQRLEPQGTPHNVLTASQEAMNDLPAISGINEALMGTDVSNLQSGRAIELKQKQAITHIALLFDNLRFAKETIAHLLWGRRGAMGIVPQFYTEEKTFRITGENGKHQFITVNQRVKVDEQGQTITRTLNDLTVGEFDIVIADTPATATQRTAQFWSLVDACGKLGIQGNMVLDILLDLSDIPEREEVKRRLQQQQQQQSQAQQQEFQMRMELEREKKLSRSIAYKDLQLPLQLQLASKAGIFPKEYADKFMEWSVQQYANMMGIPEAPIQQPIPQVPIQPNRPAPQQALTQSAVNGLLGTDKPII